MNKEFQELKALLGTMPEKREEIIRKMRDNLIKRNGSSPEYRFKYTKPSVVYNIETCSDEQDLYEIDGDIIVFEKK